MAKKQSLGKGLDLIFDDNTIDPAGGVSYLELSSVSPKPGQPRKYFDTESLSDLASSIAAHGVLQPVIVKDLKNGSYELIAGERRYRASKLAGLSEIPAIVMDADDITAAEISIIENVQREDLNPYEEASAYSSLVDDFGLTQEEVSKMVGKSRPAIANSLRLLELPKEVINLIVKKELSAGHGRTLLGLKDRADIVPLAIRAVKKNLSVRELESAVRKLNRKDAEQPAPSDEGLVVDYRAELERRATALSGRRIKISAAKNRRTVTVEYTSDEDLEAVLTALCGKEIIEQ